MRRVVPALLIVVIAAGCNGNGKVYTRSDVERAFRSQGFELVAPTSKLVTKNEAVLAPKTGESFIVLIFKNEKRARAAARVLARQATPETLDVRQGNVVVESDEGVTRRIRTQIHAALSRLTRAAPHKVG
jgi:hypothetical protein